MTTGEAPPGARPAAPCDGPTISVVIAAYSSDRWARLREAVDSVAAQARPALETIVVIDHNPGLLDRARRELPGAAVIPNAGARGASGARNTGVARSRGDIVAFLDDDAHASDAWLESLVRHFADPGVVGAGGRVDPIWATGRPAWFPAEFGWTVGVSYTGMPREATPVRNVWTCNMAVRRAAFQAAGGFREDFGKVGTASRPEDTDLCLRVTGGSWMYEPTGAVGHWVPGERASVRYFLRRSYNEGLGKAGLAALDGTAASMSTERRYALRVLPRGIGRGLLEAASGDWSGAKRAAAIMAGLGMAGIGFTVGALTRLTASQEATR